MPDIGFGVIGLGRMGMVHAENLASMIRGGRLVAGAVDPRDLEAVRARQGFQYPVVASAEELLANPEVEAVVIASPSSVHDEHVRLAAARRVPIFCEKPLSNSVARASATVQAVEQAGVPFQIGFHRRFDEGYARARDFVQDGSIGEPELFRGITSDHIPPLEYLRTSGGLFWDLGVHDFDAARFLMDDEVVAVHAAGAMKVEPRLSEIDDIDYGVTTLRFRKGGLGVVQNSWRAPWGCEVRAEVCGSKGRVVTEQDEKVPTRLYAEEGIISERHQLFMERFREAYRSELQAFVDALHSGVAPSPGAQDGLRAIQVSEAATLSSRENRWVEIGS
jgi:myo-inositol 2-dehydrogenase / D-chiro-inositol 1-dehydrogenase